MLTLTLIWNSRIDRAVVNLSFSLLTSMALLPVHLQRALSTVKKTRKKQSSQNSHHFPNVYFQVTFSLPLQSLTKSSEGDYDPSKISLKPMKYLASSPSTELEKPSTVIIIH